MPAMVLTKSELISSFQDEVRILLHLTTAAVAAACVGGLLVMRDSVFVGTLCLAYCAAWFYLYAKAAW